MNDREETNDTEPSGAADMSAEPGADTDPSGDEVTEPGPLSQRSAASPTDDSSEDFFRWLPTLWLWHRRRRELVERRSSDGGDFVAYASAGRPVRASVSAEAKNTVEVRPLGARPSHLAGGERADAAETSERDAPTVLLPKRSGVAGRKGVIALSVVALGLVAVAIGRWSDRPRGKDDAVRAQPAATALGQTPGAAAAPSESPAPPAPPVRASDQDRARHTPDARTTERPMAGAPPVKESSHKPDGIRPGALGGDAAVANRAPPPSTSTRDQYFEEP
jgi:hypothetical protein